MITSFKIGANFKLKIRARGTKQIFRIFDLIRSRSPSAVVSVCDKTVKSWIERPSVSSLDIWWKWRGSWMLDWTLRWSWLSSPVAYYSSPWLSYKVGQPGQSESWRQRLSPENEDRNHLLMMKFHFDIFSPVETHICQGKVPLRHFLCEDQGCPVSN